MQALTGDLIIKLRRGLILSQEEFAALVRKHGGSAQRVTVMRWEALGGTEIQARPRNMRALQAIAMQPSASPSLASTPSQSVQVLSLGEMIGVGI